VTVIAWDGHRFAVDSACTDGVVLQRVPKLSLFERHGRLHACAATGTARAAAAMSEWLARGAEPENFPSIAEKDDTTLIVLDLEATRVHEFNGARWGYEVESVPFAWGSGGALALGAMLAGADALEALGHACAHVTDCAGPIRYVTRGTVGDIRTLEA